MTPEELKEIKCLRAVLERILRELNESTFLGYQMEKFGKIGYCDNEGVVRNSLADPNREIVWNSYCKTHDEIFVYRPSIDPNDDNGMIEMKKCKCGCWS